MFSTTTATTPLNFVRLKRDDPARVLPGFDYDVTSTDGLLHRVSVASGVLQTTGGIRYRALALPRSRILPLPALELAQRYVLAGGVLIGTRPLRSQGIVTETDARKFAQITDALWTPCEKNADHHLAVGKGQLFCSDSSQDALKTINLSPDFEAPSDQTASLDYIHRRTAETDIYFIRNTQPKPLQTTVTLRINARQPEIFDPVTGEIHQTLLYKNNRRQPNQPAPAQSEPYGSVFIVFRHPAAKIAVTSITRDGRSLYSSASLEQQSLPFTLTVENDGGTRVLHTPELADTRSLSQTGRPGKSMPSLLPKFPYRRHGL